jgi:hypothetical protein
MVSSILQKVSSSQVEVTQLPLKNLDEEYTAHFVADVLELHIRAVESIASLLHTKTNGNLYTIQLCMCDLVRSGSMEYVVEPRPKWLFHAEEIRLELESVPWGGYSRETVKASPKGPVYTSAACIMHWIDI